ncbi:MAG: hypothetical protein HC913_13665 [Microscillaceae bacterium]|nr:hypothetical protein [Microscillaceae bacterium]
MKSTLVIFTLLLFLPLSVLAQDYTFKVLASSGSPSKAYPSAGGQLLKVGAKLAASASITMPAQSYLSLVHSDGTTVQLEKAGTFKVSDLVAKMNQAKKTAGQKYAAFVYDGLTMKEQENIHKNPYKYQHVTGSVERATFESELVVMMPHNSNAFQKQYLIQWHHLKGTQTYQLLVMNQFNEIIQEIAVQDTAFTLDVEKMVALSQENNKIEPADMLQLVFLSKERTDITPRSKENVYEFVYALNFLSEERQGVFKQAFSDFNQQQQNGSESEVSKTLNEAFFYEEQGFLLDAQLAYQKALASDTNNQALQVAYNQFLVRYQIGKHKEIKNSEGK